MLAMFCININPLSIICALNLRIIQNHRDIKKKISIIITYVCFVDSFSIISFHFTIKSEIFSLTKINVFVQIQVITNEHMKTISFSYILLTMMIYYK